jgi:5-methyltetrahydrofolate--homocysteine methyltransferase
VVDPLVMPLGAINQAGVQAMRVIRRLREELQVNTSCGASNISFGLPARRGIDAAFLTMAMGAGMTSAITNPLHEEIVRAVMGADAMLGHDPSCMRWLRSFREVPPAGTVVGGTSAEADAARARRETRRRRA